MNREIPLEYYTERGVQPPGLSYCAAEHPDWEADDWEIARLATEIDAFDRTRNDMVRMEQEITRLRNLLYDNGIQYEEDEP